MQMISPRWVPENVQRVRHPVAEGNHLLVLEMEVREGGPVELHQAAHAFRAGRHVGAVEAWSRSFAWMNSPTASMSPR
jgi:hypothetical protein